MRATFDEPAEKNQIYFAYLSFTFHKQDRHVPYLHGGRPRSSLRLILSFF